jgi:hypothetical protein
VQTDATWQREALEDFNFRDGNQWTDQEKQILEEEMRPHLVFNLTKSSIDLIMGMNEDNRLKYRCAPVDPTDAFLCEVMNDIADWLYEANDFEEEEDAALESAAICGRGYVAIDFVPDPDRFGDVKMTLVDIPVHEVHSDPATRRPNWEDASYVCWDRWLSKEDFKMKFPKFPERKIDDLIEEGRSSGFFTGMGMPSDIWEEVIDVESDEMNEYSQPLDLNFYDRAKNMVRVVHMEYWQTYKRYFGYNPQTGEWTEFEGKNLKEIKEAHLDQFGEDLVFETLTDKKVKWLQFIGDEILFDDDSPLPYKGFSICPMFAFKDASRRSNNHYGLVRLMKDPQKEINKRWSQALNMLNQQVQPGVWAETGAFVDARQAEMSMKEAGAITWVNSGALAGGQIKERTVPVFPNAPMQMEQFSQDIMKKITGINPDLLGQDRGRQEPGVVIRLRQQQGITLLKPLFKALNRMKKDLFKRMLAIVMEYMPTTQLLRILGQGDRYQVDKETGMIVDTQSGMQADIRDIRNVEYNLKAEESPGNMTKRMLELSSFMEMMQAGMPVDPRIIVEKTDLPASDKARWLEYIDSQEQSAQQAQQEQTEKEAEFRDREIAVDEQANLMEFITDMAKLTQAREKESIRAANSQAQMALDNEDSVRNLMSNLMAVAKDYSVAKQQAQAQKEMKPNETRKETKPV